MLRSRWFALVILCAATLMIILDGTIVTVALPVIQADLGFTPASLSWVMDSYLIAFGGLLLLSGRLGDLLGRKRMFLAGLAVFTLASLACGLAAGPGMLIAARFVQGIGGAMASSVTLGMIVRLFSQPAEQRRAIGAFSFVGAVGASSEGVDRRSPDRVRSEGSDLLHGGVPAARGPGPRGTPRPARRGHGR